MYRRLHRSPRLLAQTLLPHQLQSSACASHEPVARTRFVTTAEKFVLSTTRVALIAPSMPPPSKVTYGASCPASLLPTGALLQVGRVCMHFVRKQLPPARIRLPKIDMRAWLARATRKTVRCTAAVHCASRLMEQSLLLSIRSPTKP